MTKSELIEHISENEKISKVRVEAGVNAIFESMAFALIKNKRIEVRGFGTFTNRQRDSRVGRNPKTGEPVQIPSKKVPFFKAGKILKEFLNQ